MNVKGKKNKNSIFNGVIQSSYTLKKLLDCIYFMMEPQTSYPTSISFSRLYLYSQVIDKQPSSLTSLATRGFIRGPMGPSI